ncbi:hypothetical protein B0H11DRAFT_1913947 [Mycena galericulata]|nr:hypothetical protein B0H11DRAFT_1913947 [Mycena galericulata]
MDPIFVAFDSLAAFQDVVLQQLKAGTAVYDAIMYPASPDMAPGKITIAAKTVSTTHTDTTDVDYIPWLTGQFPPKGVKHYSIDITLGKVGGTTKSFVVIAMDQQAAIAAEFPINMRVSQMLDRDAMPWRGNVLILRRTAKARPLSSVALDDVWEVRDAVLCVVRQAFSGSNNVAVVVPVSESPYLSSRRLLRFRCLWFQYAYVARLPFR